MAVWSGRMMIRQGLRSGSKEGRILIRLHPWLGLLTADLGIALGSCDDSKHEGKLGYVHGDASSNKIGSH